MNDTSFAIHPENKNTLNNVRFFDIGNYTGMVENNNLLKFTCEHGFVDITFYRDDILRITMNPEQAPSLQSTHAVVLQKANVQIDIHDNEGEIFLNSKALKVKINKKPFRVSIYDPNDRPIVKETDKGMGYSSKKEVVCYKDMDANDHFYGFGEKTGFLDKRGEKLIMWNTDVYAPHNPETNALYESIPFFMTLREGNAHGIFFDNSFKAVFDMKSSEEFYSFSAEGGQLDYYVLAGQTPKNVLEQYTLLTGRMPLPPKWALGYHQSRYSYETEGEVRELAKTFLEKKIPLDVIYLDIHYMDGYRVFTFDQGRFPAPKKLISDLKEAGIRIIPIVDPGVKEDPEYYAYREGVRNDHFCKYLEGNIYFGDVWPGKSAFPDFTSSKVRKWWGEKHSFYTELGIEGIWNDMNEPAVFNETKTMDEKVVHDNDGDPRTHKEMHNLYGLMMGEATYEGMKKLLSGKRPFLLTRAGYSGVQRYAAVWTGDNRSFWEHLAMSLPMCMNLGLSGVAFTGPDVGGFAHDTTGELLTRWTQVGVFTPYFRNHSAIETVRQEPWSFGEKYEKIIKRYIELRYEWLPHLYNLFVEAAKTGVPVMRPLFMEYPNDQNTFNLSDQFMIGNNVLIAPILQPNTNHRAVYLPEGEWYDYWTNITYRGGQHVLVKADLDILPIFIKTGSVILNGTVKQSTAYPEKEMIVNIYPAQGKEFTYTIYDDDGETFAYQSGDYLEKKIQCNMNDTELHVSIEDTVTNYQPTWKQIRFNIHGINEEISISFNDHKLGKEKIKYHLPMRVASFVISI